MLRVFSMAFRAFIGFACPVFFLGAVYDALLGSGAPLMTFPEGRRTSDGALQPSRECAYAVRGAASAQCAR